MTWKRAALTLALSLCAFAAPSHAEQAVCVRVKLEIPQRLTFERDAFEATLRLTNRLTDAPLDAVSVDVVIRPLSPQAPPDPIFVAAPTLGGMSGGIDGTGSIAAAQQATIQWLLVPSPGAGGQLPGGLQYAVKAVLHYQANGVAFDAETFEEIITVRPQPELSLRYFLPRHVRGDDPFTPAVEPSVPFELGVRVRNVGHGTARNLQIESAQPRIVENQLGLLASFDIVGTWRNAEVIPNTLAIPFGDLEPSTCAMGAWAMTTTYEGDFIELDVSFQHSEELGGELTSLISSARSDWLVHRVVDDRPGKDAVFDALIDFNASNDGVPERVIGSDCLEEAVTPQAASTGGSPSPTNAFGTLSTPVVVGWNWARAPDPAGGALPLLKVTRDRDGKELHRQNAWLDVDDNGQPVVAVFDHSAAGGVTETYTLVYDLTDYDVAPPETHIAPRDRFALLPDGTLVVSPTTVMILEATDDASGVAYSERSLDGGALQPNLPFFFSSGPHTVEFRSVDRRGNVEALQLVNVVVDDAAPDLVVSSPANGASIREDEGFALQLSVTDDHDDNPAVTVEIRDASGAAVLALSEGQAVPPFALFPGLYGVAILAQDFVDNGVSVVHAIEIVEKPAAPPRLVVDGLSDGQHLAQPVVLSVRVESDDPVESATITLDGAPYVDGTVVAEEREHVLHLSAVDVAGRAAEQDFRFTVDMTPPTFSVAGVVPGQLYTTGVAPVVQANDAHLASFELLLDGAPFESGTPVTSDGAHALSMTAADLAGNQASREVPFTIDLLPPQISFNIVDGQLYPVPVAATISIDDATTVESEALLDGKRFLSGALVGDGDHVLAVHAVDATLKETDASVRFSVDATPPLVRILGVSDGGIYGAGVSATVSVEDARLAELIVLLDGVTYVDGTPIATDGPHLLEARATDDAGHVTEVSAAFSVDADVPGVFVEGVEDGGLYSSAVLPDITTDDPEATLTTLLDDEPWDGGAISADGEHVLEVTATDAQGNAARLVIRFTIDSQAPAVVVVGVVDGGVYADPVTPDVTLSATDVDTVQATLDDALFGLGTEVSAPGPHTLVVVVTDEAGNETRLTVHFTIDPAAPSLALSGVEDGAHRNAPVAITAITDAGAVVTLTLDGHPYQEGTLIDAPGQHVVRATASHGGAEALSGVTFTLDFTAPALSVVGVADGAFYPDAVSPRWSADDEALADVIAVADGAPVAIGTVISGEGEHELVVTARDRAGNETAEALAFTIDETAPAITVTGVNDGDLLSPPVVPVISVDEANPASVVVTLDGAPFASGGAIEAAGDHLLEVKAVDLAGNVSQLVVTFTVLEPNRLELVVSREGVPAAGDLVFLHEEDGTDTGISGQLDEAGYVRFSEVPPGRYRARVHHVWQRFITPPLESPGPVASYDLPDEPEPLSLIYVDGAAATGGDGTAGAPFATLADAFAVAPWGALIKVAAGVYRESELLVPDGVTVRGGYLAGAWLFAPAEAITEVKGDGAGPAFRIEDKTHVVLADLKVDGGGGEEGGAIYSRDSSPLLRDLVLRDNGATQGAAIFLDGGEHAHLANLLVEGNRGGAAIVVARGPARLEHVTSWKNEGDGLRHDGRGGAVLRSVFVDNGGAGVTSETGELEVTDNLSGENAGEAFGGQLAGLASLDRNDDVAPSFRAGPLHAAYLAQIRGGDDEDGPGVDAAAVDASALELRGRTTAVTGAPDIGPADLGYHAWPKEPAEGPPQVPPGCGCDAGARGTDVSGLLAALGLLFLGAARRRRGGLA